jgi:hypothetical protein
MRLQSRENSSKVNILLEAFTINFLFASPLSYCTLGSDWTCRWSVRSNDSSRYLFHQHFASLGAYYTYRDTFDLATTVLCPCGANSVLNIASDIRTSNAANKAGSGYISTDSVRLLPLFLRTVETDDYFFRT